MDTIWTERVHIEELMVQSEKMLTVGGLAAGRAHEINNPLGGMMQTASVMSRRLTDIGMEANICAAKEAGTDMVAISAFMGSRGIIRMLGRIQESGDRASEIVKNMPSFARKGDDSTAPEDMSKLLDQGIDLAGSNYDRKKNYDFGLIEIVREYAQNLPLVTCGGGEIQQVFLNILRNSAEAMHGVMDLGSSEKSFLILRIRKDSEAGMLRIEIEDNGPGMKEETRKRIFEPFFTTKATDQGTGLGLSVSYFIITETHRGKMSVEPTCGVGTKFIIRLPIEGKSLWISQNRESWFSTIMMLFAKA